MFTHQGKSRTLQHNIQIATVLSFIAGLVNVVGFLALGQLTTNVTGHFAFFMHDLSNFEFWKGTVYLLFILAFLAGSFFAGILLEYFKENKQLNVFAIPILLEAALLIGLAVFSQFYTQQYPHFIACTLLFAMGLQNSFVTNLSNAVVRTTHLTGLFTDLGIELSQLFFPKSHPQQTQIRERIKLRIYIIAFFFLGGSLGGYLYSSLHLELHTLYIAAGILLLSLLYDDFRYRLLMAKRKLRKK